eukprot:6307868-Amphidinium_carterae.1
MCGTDEDSRETVVGSSKLGYNKLKLWVTPGINRCLPKQPPWYQAALANYNIAQRLQWIFFDHDNPKDWIAPMPDDGMQVIFTENAPVEATFTGQQNSGPNYVQQTQTQQSTGPNYVQQPQTQQNAGPNYVQQVQPSQNAQRCIAQCDFNSMAVLHSKFVAAERRSCSLILAETFPI